MQNQQLMKNSKATLSEIQDVEQEAMPQEVATPAAAETVQVNAEQLNVLIKDRENLMSTLNLANSSLSLIEYKIGSSLLLKKGTKLNIWQIIMGAKELIHIIEEIVRIIKGFREQTVPKTETPN